ENSIVDEEGQLGNLNPEFTAWIRQDQILVSWLLGSITESILAQMVDCNNAAEVWGALERIFSSQSKAKIMQYKLWIQSLKKGGLSMREYLVKMKTYANILASVGHIVTEEDQILYILIGLSSDYYSLVVSVTSRVEPYRLQDVTALLLAHENRLEQQH
ncbi:hypothetical protein TorRG33x02_119460, partial [Trema orientale]